MPLSICPEIIYVKAKYITKYLSLIYMISGFLGQNAEKYRKKEPVLWPAEGKLHIDTKYRMLKNILQISGYL